MKAKLMATMIFFGGLSGACLADSSSAHSAITIAKLDLSESLVQLAEKQASCDESAIVLEPGPILSAGLSKAELKTALAYFYLKAFIQCSFQEASTVVTNLHALALLQPQNNETAAEAAQLFTHDLAKLWQAEAKYMKIEKSKRMKLERTLEPLQPFEMIESAQRLGL